MIVSIQYETVFKRAIAYRLQRPVGFFVKRTAILLFRNIHSLFSCPPLATRFFVVVDRFTISQYRCRKRSPSRGVRRKSIFLYVPSGFKCGRLSLQLQPLRPVHARRFTTGSSDGIIMTEKQNKKKNLLCAYT